MSDSGGECETSFSQNAEPRAIYNYITTHQNATANATYRQCSYSNSSNTINVENHSPNNVAQLQENRSCLDSTPLLDGINGSNVNRKDGKVRSQDTCTNQGISRNSNSALNDSSRLDEHAETDKRPDRLGDTLRDEGTSHDGTNENSNFQDHKTTVNNAEITEHQSRMAALNDAEELGECQGHRTALANAEQSGECQGHRAPSQNLEELGECQGHKAASSNAEESEECQGHRAALNNAEELGECQGHRAASDNAEELGKGQSHIDTSDNAEGLGECQGHKAALNSVEEKEKRQGLKAALDNAEESGETIHTIPVSDGNSSMSSISSIYSKTDVAVSTEYSLLVHIIQEETDPEEIRSALEKIKGLIDNDDFISVAVDLNLWHYLSITVEAHEGIDDIQIMGCKIITELCKKRDVIRKDLQGSSAYRSFISILIRHPLDEELQLDGGSFLVAMFDSEDIRNQILLDEQINEFENVVFSMIKNFSSSVDIQRYALQLLHYALMEDLDLYESFLEQHFTSLRQCLFLYGNDISIMQTTLSILVDLASNDGNVTGLLDYKIDQIATETMSAMCGHQAVVENCCVLISLLSKKQTVKDAPTELSVSFDLLYETIIPLMWKYPTSDAIQVTGLRLFCSSEEAVKVLERRAVCSEESCYSWCNLIYSAMVKHMNNEDIQKYACRTLSRLLEIKPDINTIIGEDESNGKRQVPLHSMCLGILMLYGSNEVVFQAVCETFYWMAADNVHISRVLMDKNAYLLILDGVHRHLRSAKSLEVAFRAIRGLCIFQITHKKDILTNGIQSLLNKALKMYSSDPDLMLEVICSIACFADIDFVCYQCFVDNTHRKILKIMSENLNNLLIQEAGLECLSVLTSSDMASELLNAAGAIQHVCAILEKFTDVLNIQKKGLMLLQLLVDKTLSASRELSQRLAQNIVTSMKTYPDELSLLKEACVTVQIMADQSEVTREHFVKAQCHEVLFNILAEHDDSDLQDLAAECLLIFGLDDKIKNSMLLTECKEGKLMGVKCLLHMEADINCGEGDDTPLCHAVMAQNEDIVKLLIEKGVLDVNRALSIAQDLGNHIITGHLLGTLVNRREGYDIPWNSLGLGKSGLQSEWFVIALNERPDSTTRPEISIPSFEHQDVIGDQIVTKVRQIEAKRKERQTGRLHPSNSEPVIGLNMLGRRFRYNVSDDQLFNRDADYAEEKVNLNEGKRRLSLQMNLSDISQRLEYKKRGMYTPGELSPIASPSSSCIEFSTQTSVDSATVFEASNNDFQEWKETSLSGANIPYSTYDPRVRRTSQTKLNVAYTGPWRRKARSPSPSHTNLLFGDQTGATSDDNRYGMSGLSSDGEMSDYKHRSRHDSRDSIFSDTESRTSNTFAPPLQTPKSLDLSDNALLDLYGLVDAQSTLPLHFNSLEILNLDKNLLKNIPSSLNMMMPRLVQLDLKNNNLTTFPEEVLRCENLKILELDYNYISIIESHTTHSMLKELCISHNLIRAFPYDVMKCQNLRLLHLNCNKIKSLSRETPLTLEHLQKLYLSHNCIEVITDVFLSQCPKLEHLEISYNGIVELPNESIASSLPRLAKLRLRNNKLSTKEPFFIPKFIVDLPSLRSVDVSENELHSLPPPSAWKSPMLKELLASRNMINKISLDGAKALSKLELFNLSENGLLEIPKEIGQLTSLTSLDISYNKITTLPDELGKCSKLWEMPLHGLPNLTLDPTLVKGRVKDLIIYLHNKLKKATEFYRMKLMVIGYGGRGKSTLLRALMKNFKGIEKNQPTVGVIVKDWKLELHLKDKRGTVTCTLNTWDFAGQEEFYSSHQCYISGRAIYLVVCNLRKGPSEIDLLKPWLSTIHARALGCPVVFVMTHLDQIHDSMREKAVTQMNEKLAELVTKAGFPEIKGSYAVICTKEGDTIHNLRTAIKDVILGFTFKGQPVMGQKIPESYVKLSEILENEAKKKSNPYPVITWNRLQRIVQEANLDLDKEELHQAVHFLHESGVLLHYPEKAHNLNNLYFIDPGWLCCMMAQIVTVRQINPFIRNGILRTQDTSLLFTGKKVDKENSFIFPKELIPQYIKLLEKFEIALPHSDTELLIPCHLPDKRPNLDIPSLPKNEKIRRYYVMPYVPMGMWPRLITRMIAFSQSTVTEMLLRQKCLLKLAFWKKGILMFWDKNVFCLLESNTQNKDGNEEIQITVPASKTGVSILCLVVDHVDVLIDEWYPGLTTIDPLQGKELLEKLVPCPKCNDEDYHVFNISDLSLQADVESYTACPCCFSDIPMANLVPDVMLSDLEPEFLLDKDQFDFKESAECLIGDGGFGSVYKVYYKKQAVAVKVFSRVADIDPNKMLRQEATILRCLHHPSVVSLLAVSREHRAIILELAPLGSLSDAMKEGKICNRNIQHKIAMQTAEGVAYLHQIMIVYRDMKPDNVLIFSTSLTATVNAKVSDYGIARFSTPDGLTAQEGTPAYRAPEVIRGETYSFKADVFSLGVTLYSLVTDGRHPFDNLEYKSEMDRAFAEGQSAPPITQKQIIPWPCMQQLLTSCLQHVPDNRPSSEKVVERLKDPDIIGLKRVIPISVGTTVECLTIQEQDGGKVYLWIASGDSDTVQLSRLDLMDHTAEIKGAMFKYGRILSLKSLSGGYLLVGTQMSKIWLYDTIRHEFIHCTSILSDAVLCMRIVQGANDSDDIIFAGLANGTICVFLQSELLCEPNAQPMCLSIGQHHDAVRCMEVSPRRRKIYASCGSKIVLIDTRKGIAVAKVIETVHDGDIRPIYGLAVSKTHMMVCHKGSCVIQVWDIGKEVLRHNWNVSSFLNLDGRKSRVTSICLQKRQGHLWVGTGGGHIVLIDERSGKAIQSAKKYTGAVRTLEHIKTKGTTKYTAVLSGGLGFVERSENSTADTHDECGCVLVWDTDFGDKTKILADDISRRDKYIESFKIRTTVTKDSTTTLKDSFSNLGQKGELNEMFDSL